MPATSSHRSLAPLVQRRKGKPRKPKPPKKCPACGTATVKPEGAVFTVCPNRRGCPGQSFQHVKHFVSKGAMEIDGLGERQARRFLEAGLIEDVADIYELSEAGLIEVEGFGRALRPQPFGVDRDVAWTAVQARSLRARSARRGAGDRGGSG